MVLTGFVLATAAKAQDVKYYVATGTDFSKYKTYKWQRAKDAKYPGEQADRIITDAVDFELAKKGLTKTEGDTADVYVIYQFAIVDRTEWSSFSTDIEWQGGANSLAGFSGATTNSSKPIRVGWLLLDIYEVAQKKQVWQATVTKTLGDGTDPKKMQKNAEKAMSKVFKKFPPPKN